LPAQLFVATAAWAAVLALPLARGLRWTGLVLDAGGAGF